MTEYQIGKDVGEIKARLDRLETILNNIVSNVNEPKNENDTIE